MPCTFRVAISFSMADTFLLRIERDEMYFALHFIVIKTSIAINKMGALNHHLLHDRRHRWWLDRESRSLKLCQQACTFLYLHNRFLHWLGLQKGKRTYINYAQKTDM